MPWELKTVEKERLEFVKEVQSGEQSKSALCRKYGISRVTGDKWLKRHAHGESLSAVPYTHLTLPTKRIV